MRRLLAVLCLLAFVSTPARADIWGVDVGVLTNILANAIQQLIKLQSIVSATEDQVKLTRDIYSGIHDAVALMKTMNPNMDPGIYKDWQEASDALSKLEAVYGPVADSRDAPVQKDADKGAAEAIALNNDIYKYSAQLDEIAEEVKASARVVSPAGAQKMTVQTLGVMLHVLNESLRARPPVSSFRHKRSRFKTKKKKISPVTISTIPQHSKRI